MKKIFFAALSAIVLFASCNNDVDLGPTVEAAGDFTAQFAETRTELNDNAVVWCENDLITIFTKTSHNRKYQVKELSDDGRTATLGYVSLTGTNNTNITSNYALYPYDADATLTGGVVTTTLQPTQTYNGTNGNLGYALMTARSTTHNFSFRNAGSLLRFKVSKIVPDEFTLNSIKVASASNNIAGEVTIDLEGNEKKAVATSNGVKEITLADINYEVTTDIAEFCVTMPSMSFADKDLTVTFVFKEGEKKFELPAFDLRLGTIKNIAYQIKDAEDFTGGTPDDDETPPVAKPAANEIWYTAKEKVTPYETDVFGATIQTNEWNFETGEGVIIFDGEVTEFGRYAFGFCSNLTSITLPEGVSVISSMALSGCECLASIDIPESVTTIENYAFDGCVSLTSITLPEGLSIIEYGAFYACSELTSITIPESITEIGDYAFYECSNLREFKGKFAWSDGRCLIKDGSLITFAPAGLTEYTIPDGVTTIGVYAFANCSNLTSITIPKGVTAIGDYAFNGCKSLTSITLPEGVTVIGYEAFDGCTALTSITLPEGVTEIGYYAFQGCSNLINITIPEGVTTIGVYTFQGCTNLASITIPEGVTEIGYKAFDGCKSLTSINLPKSVKEIGYEAFNRCNSLTSITIPEVVTVIEGCAFSNCSNLTGVYCEPTTPPTLGSNAFKSASASLVIYVPAESVEAYKAADGWSNYADKIVGYDFEKGEIVPDAPASPANNEIWYTTTDGEMANVYRDEAIVKSYMGSYYSHYYDETNGVWVLRFDDLEKLWKFPNIDETWFFSENVSSVIMPDYIEEVTGLQGLPNLTIVTLPANLKNIGRRAFANCTSLENIIIPDGVTSIEDAAFYDCKKLSNITLPNSITSIGVATFYGCDNIRSLTIPDGVKTLNRYSIPPHINTLTIGSGVTEINNNKFYTSDSWCAHGALQTVYCKPTTPPTGLGGYQGLIYEDLVFTTTIYVPCGCADTYKKQIDLYNIGFSIVEYDF